MKPSIILNVICCYGHLTVAMIVTKYEKTSAPITSEFMSCGISAMSMDYCAARVTTDNKCEPLSRDWCETKDMSMGGTYFIKRTIMHMPEVTLMSAYDEHVPINMTDGSEVEMKLMFHTSEYIVFQFDLSNKDNQTVIRIWMTHSTVYFCCGPSNSINDGSQNCNGSVGYSISTDVIYTLRMVSYTISNTFQIYLDDDHIWTYATFYKINSTSDVSMAFFGGTEIDLYYISYKYGDF